MSCLITLNVHVHYYNIFASFYAAAYLCARGVQRHTEQR